MRSVCGTSGRRKLCMVPGHSCHIYGIWRSREVRNTLKSPIRVVMQAKSGGGSFYGEAELSAVLKLYCKSF